MKYPISLNDFELEEIKQIGKLIGIDNIHEVYGGIAKVLKLGIKVTKKTIDDIERVIPDLDIASLDILLQSVRKKKLLKYHRQKEEIKKNRSKLV